MMPARVFSGRWLITCAAVGFEVGQDDGDNLRVLEANDLGNRFRVHPLQRFQAVAAAAHQNAVDDAAGLVAEGFFQHGTNIGIVADTQRGLRLQRVEKIIDDMLHRRPRDVIHHRHGGTNQLHFLRVHVLQNLGGNLFTQSQQQNPGFFRPLDGGFFILLLFGHYWSPTQCFITLATRAGSSITMDRAMSTFCS